MGRRQGGKNLDPPILHSKRSCGCPFAGRSLSVRGLGRSVRLSLAQAVEAAAAVGEHLGVTMSAGEPRPLPSEPFSKSGVSRRKSTVPRCKTALQEVKWCVCEPVAGPMTKGCNRGSLEPSIRRPRANCCSGWSANPTPCASQSIRNLLRDRLRPVAGDEFFGGN